MKVTVIGVGKIGLAYASFISSKGHEVTGIETNLEYLKSLQDGSFVCLEPGVQEYINSVTYTDSDVGGSDICIILVCTPTCYAGYDHSVLEKVLQDVSTKNHKRIIVSCTTQPGFCEKWVKLIPHLYYSPLFIQLGNVIKHQSETKNVLIGGNEDDIVRDFYHSIHGSDAKLHFMNHTASEVAKLGLNCFLTTKISFANMIGESLLKCGNSTEIDKVLSFIGSDDRVGNKYLKYGWGYGGPCFPRDNRALCTFLRRWGASDYIPVATHETNERHAITMSLTAHEDEYKNMNYKDDCPYECTEESHKQKALWILKNGV
jgi:nucleotide sugar dehydrogenase